MAISLPKLPWEYVGPHGYFDLVRLARSGRTGLVRVAYVLALFAALAVSFYSSAPPDGRDREASINWNARIAERFSATILVMQNIAVLVLTPIYMAAGIQEERDKGTFPLLFTTHLTAREIVLGKWLSRCVQVGTVLLAGLPVLAVAQLWGGIDMAMIAANFLHTGMLLFAVGAFSLMLAVQDTSMMVTLFKAYIVLALLFTACMVLLVAGVQQAVPMLAPFGSGPGNYVLMWIVAGMFTGVYSGATLGMLRSAALALERMRNEDRPVARQHFQVEPAVGRARNRFWRWPTLPECVVAWKERYLGRSIWHIIPNLLFAGTFSVFVTHFCAWVADARAEDEPVRLTVGEALAVPAPIMLGCFGIYILFVTVRLTGCVVRERQQQTLETLLTLPITPGEVLYQKLVGNLQRHWTWLLPAGLAWLILVLFAEGRLAIGLVLPFVLAVHLAFFATLGLFLSVVCRTTLTAYVSLGVILVLLLGMPLFFWFVDFSENARAVQRGVHPVLCWLTIATDWWRPSQATAGPEIVLCVSIYAVAAMMLWTFACRRFARAPLGA